MINRIMDVMIADIITIVIVNDIFGKEIYKGIGVEEINFSSFEKGTYFLTLSKVGQSSTFKIIKK